MKPSARTVPAVLVILVLLASVLIVQSGPGTVGNLAFDVVSVKANKLGSVGDGFGGSGGRWTMTNIPLAALIRTAYPSPTDELVGAPAWVESEAFDVDARASFSPTREQEHMMLRRLLADRFKFLAHYETQVRPVYNMTVARADGRVGPQLIERGRCLRVKDYVRRLAAATAATGARVWFDEWTIRPGDSIPGAIDQAWPSSMFSR